MQTVENTVKNEVLPFSKLDDFEGKFALSPENVLQEATSFYTVLLIIPTRTS